jgi:hypothetical protein
VRSAFSRSALQKAQIVFPIDIFSRAGKAQTNFVELPDIHFSQQFLIRLNENPITLSLSQV